ncbi:hypothetical protein KFL_002200130 [Klebsormidium nitens]|uniref:Pentraxin (PTX) domain-containing protein n=1 Tax=Klebsormidium nitens TaxID=105231 RepID=A0A1Y1IAJ8_KLENI|nr:hypothetical protein KFL_002200130 [Klebsormidium nitens]|eukprot:GAQ85128.1 hypothetical protein KFL_002200130 [Klebsormidium nitens]
MAGVSAHCLLLVFLGSLLSAALAQSDGPQMLLFGDHVAMARAGPNFPTTQLTFETWLKSHDTCHKSTPFSYSGPNSPGGNGFVIFDSGDDMIICIEELYIVPTCYGWQDNGIKVGLSDGLWHHLAVTWNGEQSGRVMIYVDGVLAKAFDTFKTGPLPGGGIMVLGNEQDCVGGCFETGQSYYGAMDEIRLWRVERSQAEILQLMHQSGNPVLSAPGAKDNLVGYWPLDERGGDITFDKSHRGGNNFNLTFPPVHNVTNEMFPLRGSTNKVLAFSNNFARSTAVKTFPTGSFSVEMWAVDQKNLDAGYVNEGRSTLFSYAAEVSTPDESGSHFEPLAVWIYKDNSDDLMSVVINSMVSRDTEVFAEDHKWHHYALTWDVTTGVAILYMDGQKMWDGSVDAGATRAANGCLVLGQNQHCCGGCFASEESLHGGLAEVRVWDKVLSDADISAHYNQPIQNPASEKDLAIYYDFQRDQESRYMIVDASGKGNDLILGSAAPLWQESTCPLEGESKGPPPNRKGYAASLDGTEALLATAVKGLANDQFTFEVWMRSIDVCNDGTLFSYRFGNGPADQVYLIRRSDLRVGLEIAVNGDVKGTGLRAADGTWHHIAVTWNSADGRTIMYNDGVEVFRDTFSKQKAIAEGGTLSIGGHLGCVGGCINSSSPISPGDSFVGDLDEIRLWRKALSAADIAARWKMFDIKATSDLAGYWTFDEGQGFATRDVGRYGNHLSFTRPPTFLISTAGEYAATGGQPPPGGSRKGFRWASFFITVLGLAVLGAVGYLVYLRWEVVSPLVDVALDTGVNAFNSVKERLFGQRYARNTLLEELDGGLDDYTPPPEDMADFSAGRH